MAQQPYWSKASLLSGIHDHIQLDAPQTVGLLWTSDQLGAETSIWQHTTLPIDRHLCPRQDSNQQSQQASGRRPMPQTARPVGSAFRKYTSDISH